MRHYFFSYNWHFTTAIIERIKRKKKTDIKINKDQPATDLKSVASVDFVFLAVLLFILVLTEINDMVVSANSFETIKRPIIYGNNSLPQLLLQSITRPHKAITIFPKFICSCYFTAANV